MSSTANTRNMFDKVLIRLVSIVLFANTLILTCIITGAAAARYIFKVNFYGYEEIAVLFAFWFYFAGAAYGAYNNTHVSADVVDAYFPDGRTKQVIALIRHIVTACVCALFVYYAYGFFDFGLRGPMGNFQFQPKSMVWRIPHWTSYLAILIGLIVMDIYFIRNAVLSARALLSGKKEAAR